MSNKILILCFAFLSLKATAQQIYLADNGLTASQSGSNKVVKLGGTLTQNTDIDLGSTYTFKLKKSSASYLFIQNNGYVGIGTATPRGLFDVSGPGDVFLSEMPNGGSDQSVYLTGHVYLAPRWITDTAFIMARRQNNTGNVELRFRVTNDATGIVEAMHINKNGYVGIGKRVPTSQLHTTGTVRFEGITNNNSAPRVLSSDSLGNVTWRDVTTINNSNWNISGSNLYNTNTGFVGIGTSVNPAGSDTSFKFAVKGGIYAKKVKISVTGWSDYVFESDYDLPSLSFVEHYILQHKHLPDMPSADEVEKNGIDVGSNQALLLRKIEELTLYAIEQNKRIELLEKELKAMKDTKPK